MNSPIQILKLAILTSCLSVITGFSLDANDSTNSHGHVIYTDREGHHTELDECDDDGEEDNRHCHPHHHHYYDDEEDPTEEVEADTAWPSKKENFSEMFK